MTTLTKAPLIEVATQFRWGPLEADSTGELEFSFPLEEQEHTRVAIDFVLRDAGFSRVTSFAPELEDVPFAYSRQYRRPHDEWPIIRTGLGAAGVNVGNETYDWHAYKRAVVDGFGLIDRALQERYSEGVPYFGCELSYLDGFPLAEDETPTSFLQTKFNARLLPPREFIEAPFMEPQPNIAAAGLSFEIRLVEPTGILIVELKSDPQLLGRQGFTMDTSVRSLGSDIEYTVDGIGSWMDLAHNVQRHAFRTLIKKGYWETFQ